MSCTAKKIPKPIKLANPHRRPIKKDAAMLKTPNAGEIISRSQSRQCSAQINPENLWPMPKFHALRLKDVSISPLIFYIFTESAKSIHQQAAKNGMAWIAESQLKVRSSVR